MFEKKKSEFVSALGLPKDVLLGDMILTFTGSRSVLIENYRSIILYTDTVLKLQGKTCRLIIEGKRLFISYYDREQLLLSGYIKSAVFEAF